VAEDVIDPPLVRELVEMIDLLDDAASEVQSVAEGADATGLYQAIRTLRTNLTRARMAIMEAVG
jgi:hypothetical protein